MKNANIISFILKSKPKMITGYLFFTDEDSKTMKKANGAASVETAPLFFNPVFVMLGCGVLGGIIYLLI